MKTTMSARFLAVAVALLTMLFTVAAQDDDDVVRVTKNLVTVPMSVLDRWDVERWTGCYGESGRTVL